MPPAARDPAAPADATAQRPGPVAYLGAVFIAALLSAGRLETPFELALLPGRAPAAPWVAAALNAGLSLAAIVLFTSLRPRWRWVLAGMATPWILSVSLGLASGWWWDSLPAVFAIFCTGLYLRGHMAQHQLRALQRLLGHLESRPRLFGDDRLSAQSRSDEPEARVRRLLAEAGRVRDFVDRFLEVLPWAILLTDLEGHVIFGNGGARRYFDTQGNRHIVGAHLPYLFAPLTAEQPGADFTWWDLIDPSRSEAPIRARDTNGRDLVLRATAWRDPQGEMAGWLVTFIDVSAIRSAERGREAADAFIADELRGQLQGILSACGGSGEPETLLARVEERAARVLFLAEKFVQLSVAESRTYVFSTRPLEESVALALDANEAFATQRGVALEFEPSEATARYAVALDPDMMWRALYTLIQNAVRFSPEGGAVKVVLSADDDGREVCIAVRDYGHGIAPGEQARLVRLFQDIDLPRGVRASGLGLAFVKRVVEHHDGRVEFTSNPKQGSEFRVILPLASAVLPPQRAGVS